jgi:phage gp36-like protein
MYATADQFIATFGEREAAEVSNLDAARNTEPNYDAIEAALETASAEIDSYLARAGYELPLASVPAILMKRACDIARYHLEHRNTRDEVVARYKDAIMWLRDVARGIASVGPIGATSGNSPASGSNALWGGDRGGAVFNRQSLRGY